jgi:hypothetical protein
MAFMATKNTTFLEPWFIKLVMGYDMQVNCKKKKKKKFTLNSVCRNPPPTTMWQLNKLYKCIFNHMTFLTSHVIFSNNIFG